MRKSFVVPIHKFHQKMHFLPKIIVQRSLSLMNRPVMVTTRSYGMATPLLHGDVEVTLRDGIRLIKFNRPCKMNSITKDMSKSIIATLEESNDDRDTKLVVVTGVGDYFTSGIDLSSFGSAVPSNPDDKTETRKPKTLRFMVTLIELRKPLIALVNGPAYGMGVTMLGLCDNVYCSDKAKFVTNFTKYGLNAELGSTYTFPRIMGYAKANELLTFCNDLDAKEALSSGLVSSIFPHEKFPALAMQKVSEIASLPSKSLMYTKELIRGPQRHLLHQVHKAEQEKFDIELARVVKRLFAKRKRAD